MKRISLLALSVLLALSLLTACGSDKNEAQNQKPDQGQSSPNTPDGRPDNQPGLLPDDGEDDKSPGDKIEDGMDNMMDGMAEEAEGIWEGLTGFFAGNMPNTTEGSDALWAEYGLGEDIVESYTLQTPRDDKTAHEFVIIKVKDGQMAKAEEVLEMRKEAIAKKWADAGDADMAYAKEPVILKKGNYIMLAVHEDAAELRDEFEKLIKE